MIRDPDIAALRSDLERVGMIIAPHRDHLCGRLPLFASVRVRVDEQGRLDCEPMFGMLPRTNAVVVSTTAMTALAGGLLYATGTSSAALIASFLAIMSGFGTAWRFMVTENCVTRVQMLWAARLAARGVMASPLAPAVSPPVLRAVEVPPPTLSPPELIAAAERKR